MKIHNYTMSTFMFAIFLCFMLSSCNSGESPVPASSKKEDGEQKAVSGIHAKGPEYLFGKIKKTMNSGGYTYLLLVSDNDETWVAIPATSLKEGEDVMVNPGVPMHNFHSKTLDRTFKTIIFSSGIVDDNKSPSTVASQPLPSPADVKEHKGRMMLPKMNGIIIKGLPEGAVTVAALYADSVSFKDQAVTLKARVVKVSPRIMGKNWIHLQDGSGSEEKQNYDITVTTMDMPKVGDTVLITGILHTDRDFGAGYRYDVIIEDAKVVVQP